MRGQVHEVVGEDRRDPAVVAGAGAAQTPFSTSAAAETTLNTDAAGAHARSASSGRAQARIGGRPAHQREHAAVGIETTTAAPNGIWNERSTPSVDCCMRGSSVSSARPPSARSAT
jgi:hypothetical protein